MEIFLASNNSHKKREFQGLLPGHSILLPSEQGIDFSADETGLTFLENSLIKAKELYKLVKAPVMADDSGLCVSALDGSPGIYSSRYGAGPDGIELPAADRNQYLLSKLKERLGSHGLDAETLSTDHPALEARFVCNLVYMEDEYRICTVQETVEGFISFKSAGSGGFGYDPVFFLPGFHRTMAQLSEAEKGAVSHRGRAAARLSALLKGSENGN